MIYLALIGIAVAAIGLVIGRSLQTRTANKQHFLLGFLAVAAVILIVDAVTTPRHLWANIVVLVVMAGGVAFDFIRGRRAKTG
jgi:hypothetical protein